jgi:hypothetical protein
MGTVDEVTIKAVTAAALVMGTVDEVTIKAVTAAALVMGTVDVIALVVLVQVLVGRLVDTTLAIKTTERSLEGVAKGIVLEVVCLNATAVMVVAVAEVVEVEMVSAISFKVAGANAVRTVDSHILRGRK